MVLSSVLLEIANQMVQGCKLYGLVQVLIRLDCTMNIIIAIRTKWYKKISMEQTKWCTRQIKRCAPLQKGLARILVLSYLNCMYDTVLCDAC